MGNKLGKKGDKLKSINGLLYPWFWNSATKPDEKVVY